MKVKTNRCWQLKTEILEDCIEIKELHDGSDHDQAPYIAIPIESIDEMVLELMKFKIKMKKWEDTF